MADVAEGKMVEGNEEQQPQVEEAAKPAPPSEPQQFKLLPYIVGLQRQHGLRHGDFQRYRQFCSRRIHRVRKKSKFTQGKKQFTQKPVLPEHAMNPTFLEIPLLSAERAWAFFREDKQLSKQVPRKLQHGLSRLRKALKWADNVQNLVKDSEAYDSVTAREAEAYAGWLHGLHAFETKKWKEAQEAFARTKQLYSQLLQLASTDEEQKTYERKVQELEASVRYCVYNLEGTGDVTSLLELRSTLDDDEMDLLSDQLDSALTAKRQQEANALKEITWLDRTVPIESAKLRTQLTTAQAKADDVKQLPENTEEKALMAAYDDLLMAYSDALTTVDDLVEEETKAAGGLTSDAIQERMANLQIMRAYVEFHRLQHTLHRNLAMISRAMASYTGGDDGTRPEDIVRLYDIAAQTLDELLDVEFVEEDETFMQHAEGYKPYFRAMRCFYIAESFRQLGKPREALAMYTRTTDVIAVTRNKLRTMQQDFAKPLLDDLEWVLVKMRATRCGMQASAYLQAANKNRETASAVTADDDDDDDRLSSVPLSVTANTLDTSSAVLKRPLLEFPPEFQVMSCKPLFFDMGGSHLAFPSLSERTQTQTGATVSAVTSMFSSWWGGKQSDA